MGTGLMFAEGGWTGAGFSVLGQYYDPSGAPAWGWRTEAVLAGPDRLVVTARNISPAGDEAKAVETEVARTGRRAAATPCAGRAAAGVRCSGAEEKSP
jgi:hypothetical protein